MTYQVVPKGRSAGFTVLSADQMRGTDHAAIQDVGIPGIVLMEHAGRHVAEAAQRLRGGHGSVIILAGKGNNGGDGFVAARHLLDWGVAVCVHATMSIDDLTGDALTACKTAIAAGVSIRWRGTWNPDEWRVLDSQDVFVDALCGTGLKGALRTYELSLVQKVNRVDARILSVDIPTGICADTGRILGGAIHAEETVTFHSSQPGHWLFPGRSQRGHLRIVDIGIPERAMPSSGPRMTLMSQERFGVVFKRRSRQSHKGDYGHVACLGGALGKSGAILMAGDAAMAAGAGLVTIGTTSDVQAVLASDLYETMSNLLMEKSPDEFLASLDPFDSLVVGPGFPEDERADIILSSILASQTHPLVLDAGALNRLARFEPTWSEHPKRIITPHPGEAARLLGCSVTQVQANRFASARLLAQKTASICILKGAHTVVSTVQGDLWICAAGTPAMATAGMGDVLSGVVGALLARGLSAIDASIGGVLWHALSGEHAVRSRGENGLRARDVIESLAEVERCYHDSK